MAQRTHTDQRQQRSWPSRLHPLRKLRQSTVVERAAPIRLFRVIRDGAFEAYRTPGSKPSRNISSAMTGSGQTQAPRERVQTASVVKPRS